jgi:hypothetical protein
MPECNFQSLINTRASRINLSASLYIFAGVFTNEIPKFRYVTERSFSASLWFVMRDSCHLTAGAVSPAPMDCISVTQQTIQTNQTPWPESVNDLHRPSSHLLSAKLVPTFADSVCCVISVTDPYGCIL